MKITIKDIAKKANVSITTVSRVLNNKPEGIGNDTRKRILKIIEELDYRPSSIARSMVTKKTNTIGLIIPDIRNPFFPELVRGAEDMANQLEYNIFLMNTDGESKKESMAFQLMNEQNVDGVLFTGSYGPSSQSILDSANKYRIPIVLLDRETEEEKFSGVFIENEKAGYCATKYLLDLSHVKIGCITGPIHIQNSKSRLSGYIKALTESGVEIDNDLIVSGDYIMEGGYKAAKQLLKNKEITAIFALNDLMAFGVYQAAEEAGIRIPEELSVMGFDNIQYNKLLSPKLTTIEQSTYNMGEIATEMLINQIIAGKDAEKKVVYLEPTLKVRDSCKELTVSDMRTN